MKNKLKIFEQILQEAKDSNNGEYYYLDIDWKDTYGDIINSIPKLVEEEKFQRFKNLSYIKVDEAEEICDSIPDYKNFSGMRYSYHAHSYPYGESGGRTKRNYCQFYKYTKI